MDSIFNIVTIVSAGLLTVLILMQARGASLGAGFGGSSELHTTRRGADKSLHRITVFMSLAFIVSIVLTITVG